MNVHKLAPYPFTCQHCGKKNDYPLVDYPAYLKTEHWNKVREAALERADYRCQLCNSNQSVQVHHRTYENIGAERDCDLFVLCDECHEDFHKIKEERENRRNLNKPRLVYDEPLPF